MLMKLGQQEQRKAERQEKTNDQCCKGHWFIFRNLFLEIYSYTTVIVMCPKQQQNANWNQVEIEILIVKGRNLPRTNSTKSETQIIFAKKQQNEHTPEGKRCQTVTIAIMKTDFKLTVIQWDLSSVLRVCWC